MIDWMKWKVEAADTNPEASASPTASYVWFVCHMSSMWRGKEPPIRREMFSLTWGCHMSKTNKMKKCRIKPWLTLLCHIAIFRSQKAQHWYEVILVRVIMHKVQNGSGCPYQITKWTTRTETIQSSTIHSRYSTASVPHRIVLVCR